MFNIPYDPEHGDSFYRIAFTVPVLLKWQNSYQQNKIFFLETGLNLKYYRQEQFDTEVDVHDDAKQSSHRVFLMDLYPNRIKTFILLELNAGFTVCQKNNKSLEAIVHFNYGPPTFDNVLSGTYNFYSGGKLISPGEYKVTPDVWGLGLQFAY